MLENNTLFGMEDKVTLFAMGYLLVKKLKQKRKNMPIKLLKRLSANNEVSGGDAARKDT